MAESATIDLTAAPPDDPVRAALEDEAVRTRLLAQARAITRRAAAECEDIVQAAHQRAWAKRAEYEPESGSVLVWLTGFVRNVARELARKRTPGTTAGGQLAAVPAPEQQDELDLDEIRTTVRRWLASLPEPYRTAVEWRILRDREYGELAEHLDTSPANARQLVSRGINKLKALAEQEDRS